MAQRRARHSITPAKAGVLDWIPACGGMTARLLTTLTRATTRSILCALFSLHAFAQADNDALIEPARAAIRTKDYRHALQLLTPLAEAGNASAESLLGNVYRLGLGLGVPSNATEARRWLQRAAEHGDAAAAYSLSALLAASDPQTADTWLRQAAKHGYPPARRAAAANRLPLNFNPGRDLHDAAARLEAIWLAAQTDEVELLQRFNDAELIRGADAFGRGALARAAEGGASRVVAVLLQRGANPNQADTFGATPLMLAAAGGHMQAVESLLAAGAAVNAQDRAGNTALMHAAANGRATAAKRLIGAGNNAQLNNVQGWSALDWAVYANATDIAAALRAAGVAAHRKTASFAATPTIPLRRAAAPYADLYRGWPDLMVAATRTPSTLEPLLHNSGNLNTAQADGIGALLAAVMADSPMAVEKLIAAGASIEVHGAISPLSWAVRHRQVEMVKTLLAHGANANAHGSAEDPPLLDAVRVRDEVLLEALFKTGAQLDSTDEFGRTALMLAVITRQSGIASDLLFFGATAAALDRSGRSALWHAANSQADDCLQLLLDAKTTLDKPDSAGLTPLGIAAMRGNARGVAALLSAGARVSTETSAHPSPLMLAAAAGHEGVVQKLLAAGASPNEQDLHGDTALMYATRAGQLTVVRTLLRGGASAELRNVDRIAPRDMANRLGQRELETLLNNS